MTKQEQRKHIKALLRTSDTTELAMQSQRCAERFVSMPEFKNAETILAYMAMPRECDPAFIVSCARKMKIRIAFPLCVEGNRIKLCVPQNESAFNIGAYGIIEPDENRSEILSPDDLDIIVVPGLAFDKNCNRLGRGAGYYDRLLAESRAFKAGFGFDMQLLPSVFTEAHDQKLDCVVTPSALYRR